MGPSSGEWLQAEVEVDGGRVVQVLDEAGGEAVTAVVVLSPGSQMSGQELLAYARERLAAHQAPVTVRFAHRLPRNSMGKLLRSELHALASPPGSG